MTLGTTRWPRPRTSEASCVSGRPCPAPQHTEKVPLTGALT